MADNAHTSILRRMTNPEVEEAPQSPLTTSRAVRLAMTKAAHSTLGLVVTVTAIEEIVQPLDEMLNGLAEDLMMVALHRKALPVGLIGLDMQMRAAVLELQTIGQVSRQVADIRPATSTDKQMSDPLVETFLQGLSESVAGSEFEGWLDGLSQHNIIPDTRAAALLLEDKEYRVLRLTVDLGVEDRNGSVVIALPLSEVVAPPDIPTPIKIDWEPAFRQTVSDATTEFEVELHRFQIALAQAQNLQVGEVLPLPGCTVSSARLVSLDGKVELPAKLGQIGGKRAVRIEQAPAVGMADLAALPADQPMAEVPAMPEMSAMPEMPAMAEMPAMPEMPEVPAIEPEEPQIASPMDMDIGEVALDLPMADIDTDAFELPE